MAENTKIEWAHHTFNPWEGCQKVGPGCDNCYAEARNARFAGGQAINWGPGAPRRRTSAANWKLPLKWNDEAAATGVRPRVFCASLADVFDNAVDPAWRAELFALVRRCENLDFLLLTKRVGNVTWMLQEVASILRSEHGAQAEREPGLQAGPVGRVGDRRGGSNLARREADVRSLDRRNEGDTVRASSGGTEDDGRLPAGAGNDRRQAALRGSGTAGVASLQGSDPAGAHCEPQGRGKGAQPPGQPGTGDVQRAEAARGAGAGRRAPRREGVESPEGAGVGGGCGVDEAPAGERLASEGHRGTLRRHAEVSLAHLHREDLAARLDLLAWIERWLAGDSPPNVWLGATVVNQEEADRDIPKLLAVPARVRFLSIEPMLGPINLTHLNEDRETGEINALQPDTWERHVEQWRDTSETWQEDFEDWFGTTVADAVGPMHPRIDWVIVGGESGPGARPMHPDWARSLRDQCTAAGVSFTFKQWGEWTPGENVHRQRGTVDTAFLWDDGWHVFPLNLATDGGHIDDQPDLYRVGKKGAGRHLDGRTWDEVPKP